MKNVVTRMKRVLLGGVIATGVLVAPGTATTALAVEDTDHVCFADDRPDDEAFTVVTDEFYRERGCRALESTYWVASTTSYAITGYRYYSSCENTADREIVESMCAVAPVITENDWDTFRGENRPTSCLTPVFGFEVVRPSCERLVSTSS